MGEMVHCESFLPSSMRDLTEDSNWSMYCGGVSDQNLPYVKYQNGSSTRAAADSYERDFLKRTMLEHEAVFMNQVYELHRLYRTQKSLMDEVKGKSFVDHSEHTPESAIKRELPRFLMGGEGSRSQACNVSKDEEVLEVRPMKVRRKMIDLQLPADEYLDSDGENTSSPPYEQSKPGKEVGERANASHVNGFSGFPLVTKNPNGLTDLNEPVRCQESVLVPPSRDIYSLYERNIAHVQRQWLEKNTSQNGWNVLEAGKRKSTPRDKMCVPSHPAQVFSRSLNHGYRRESVESSVASNGPSLNHGHCSESVRPWSHWIPSWENPSSSSVRKSLPLQTDSLLNSNAQARAGSSSEMRSRDLETSFNFPSGNFNHLNNGSKGAVTNGSSSVENHQAPKRQDCSARFPWIKPQPPNKNEITNGGIDLNASANQFTDGTDVGGGSSNVSVLRFGSFSDAANLGHVEMENSQSNRKILGFSISQKPSSCMEQPSFISSSVCITDQPREVNTLVRRNLDINLPCEGSVTKAIVVEKAPCRHYIDLNLCANEDEDSGLCFDPRAETKATTLIDLEAPPTLESEEEGEKRQGKPWRSEKGEAGDSLDERIKVAAEAIVTISLSHTDEAASSTADAFVKDPLSWFVNTIASCGNDLEEKIDAFVYASKGVREECSSVEFDYFEAMTLNLPQMKEEDYMPKPLVPEYLKFDDGTGSNRPRRGQVRRGRPRRDFQKDVLPGLASLSRLEVTEDIQMFEGLMKATGYNWNSGVTRRSSNRGGSSRGRKRLVSNINRAPVCSSLEKPMNNNNVQGVGLEDRSLPGWGNATRRPRRQRCPAGTLPTVILT